MGLRKKKERISSAEVIDKHLILSLPNATEPIIWRMALDKIGTASFEVKPSKNESYKLVLKPKKGAAETIANFNSKDETLEALIQASDALRAPDPKSTAQSSNKKGTSKASAPDRKTSRKWLYLLVGFLALIALYVYMASLIPEQINSFSGNTTQTNAASGDTPQPQSGVPLSADDFLNGL